MVIDITLKGEQFLITVLKSFFQLEQMNFVRIEYSRLISETYAYLGGFHLPGDSLGFEGCMKKTHEDEHYLYFTFPFPIQEKRQRSEKEVLAFSEDGSFEMARFKGSLYLLFEYCLSNAVYEKKIEPSDLKDQSFTYNFGMTSGQGKAYVAGNSYSWVQEKFNSLTAAQFGELEKYVSAEMNRFSLYAFGAKIFCEQVNINAGHWFIQGGMNGLWVNSDKHNSPGRPDEFCSHNCDGSIDQNNLFSAVVAMNTWLREH